MTPIFEGHPAPPTKTRSFSDQNKGHQRVEGI